MTGTTDDDYKHAKCYANTRGGCSSRISGEHYVSHGLIKLYGNNDPAFTIQHTNSASNFCDRSGLLMICLDRSSEDSIAPMTALTNSLCRGRRRTGPRSCFAPAAAGCRPLFEPLVDTLTTTS
jgi:hypothetical protein